MKHELIKNPESLELAVHLIKVEEPDIETVHLIQRIFEEFNLTYTVEEINAMYASYLPDNFEAESEVIKHYERQYIPL